MQISPDHSEEKEKQEGATITETLTLGQDFSKMGRKEVKFNLT